MKKLTTRFFVLLLALSWAADGRAFSLLGPFKTYQVQGIGYNLPGDLGGPMTLSEGYRWNVRTVTYALDQSFIEYFGSNGIAAIDAAMKIFNDLPDYNQITNDGSSLYIRGQRIPTDTKRTKYEAQALGLIDVKSSVLPLILEEVGLAAAERWIFALRARTVTTVNGVTRTNYSVVKANFDPITLQPSSYVDGVLYTYTVQEFMGPPVDFADAREFPAVRDPTFSFSSVSGGSGGGLILGNFGSIILGTGAGQFYTGLTQDDIGGLKYLYGTNNLATELLLPDVAGGVPQGGGSPWAPFFISTNVFANGTNFFFNANVAGTNLIVQGLRPGINKVRFQRVNFDSLIGQSFVAVTNLYTDTIITNGRPLIQPVQRIVTRPDIVFVAGDLGLLGDNLTPVAMRRTDTSQWQNNDAINGNIVQGGPGVIRPQVTIFLTDQYPYFINRFPNFIDEANFFNQSAVWASYDGTTNAPILFQPAYGTLTLDDLRNLALSK